MARATGGGNLIAVTPIVGKAFSEKQKAKKGRILLWVKVTAMGAATSIKPGIAAAKPPSDSVSADAFQVWEATAAIAATGTKVYVLGNSVGAGGAYTEEIDTVIPDEFFVTMNADAIGFTAEIYLEYPPA